MAYQLEEHGGKCRVCGKELNYRKAPLRYLKIGEAYVEELGRNVPVLRVIHRACDERESR